MPTLIRIPFEPNLSREANAPQLQAEIAAELPEFLGHLDGPAEVRNPIAFHLNYGETSEVFDDLARSEADLAVIGSHGRRVFVAATTGSDAKARIASLPCDDMLVRHGTS